MCHSCHATSSQSFWSPQTRPPINRPKLGTSSKPELGPTGPQLSRAHPGTRGPETTALMPLMPCLNPFYAISAKSHPKLLQPDVSYDWCCCRMPFNQLAPIVPQRQQATYGVSLTHGWHVPFPLPPPGAAATATAQNRCCCCCC